MSREEVIKVVKATLLEWEGAENDVDWESLTNAVMTRLES